MAPACVEDAIFKTILCLDKAHIGKIYVLFYSTFKLCVLVFYEKILWSTVVNLSQPEMIQSNTQRTAKTLWVSHV